jgi:signal transduction histidine kinase
VINSYIEMFQEGMLGELTETQREKIKVIYSQTEHMIRLVEDMLDMSRLESRRFKIKREPLRVEEIARSALADLSRLADLKEHAVSLKVEGTPPEIRGDERRIKQVFNNLLSNAIKYTPNKGKIEVRIKDEPQDLLIAISDDGVGIAKKDQERIFKKFFTGTGGSLVRESGRMGLGLAIAKGIVEAHKGSIWFESEMGKGSTFFFRLPKRD